MDSGRLSIVTQFHDGARAILMAGGEENPMLLQPSPVTLAGSIPGCPGPGWASHFKV